MILKEDKRSLLNTLYNYKCFGIEYLEDFDYNNLRMKKVNFELPDDYSKLVEFIEHCSLCELSKLTDKKTIGFGNSGSELFFVFDFVGLKDKNILNLLEKVLKTLEFSFQEIYMTNIIKCAVDLAKDNKEKYCESCKEYTLQQIRIKNPSTIIAFGESWRYFLNIGDNDSICYAKEYFYDNSSLFVLYDLEFLYKNPSYADDMQEHLKKIKRYLKGE